MHPPDFRAAYRVPRECNEVEVIAQQLARYLRVHAEDVTALAEDPSARDKAAAMCNSGAQRLTRRDTR